MRTLVSQRTVVRLQVVDCGEEGPPRCLRCKAYVNPFSVFIDGGRRFQCNLCSHANATPDWYMSPLGLDGCRRDKFDRPELCCGSVEFLATKEYMVRFWALQSPMPARRLRDAREACANVNIAALQVDGIRTWDDQVF